MLIYLDAANIQVIVRVEYIYVSQNVFFSSIWFSSFAKKYKKLEFETQKCLDFLFKPLDLRSYRSYSAKWYCGISSSLFIYIM